MNTRSLLAVLAQAFVVAALMANVTWAASVLLMSKDELRPLLGKPDVIILDVRPGISWMFSFSKIQGSLREDPNSIVSWQDRYPRDKMLVLYCQGDTTSSSVARQLASAGFQKLYVLKGGWSEWSEARFPVEKK